ncbi:hypothetical protein HAX54_048786 [Datura stramonium]|uniref:Uncharacterized protein n=1 Tax=Datura stramonium TaxID=4076 RepID=A0ABS8WNK6_DATST|nr:hypothetical protein [Datura stramonium]
MKRMILKFYELQRSITIDKPVQTCSKLLIVNSLNLDKNGLDSAASFARKEFKTKLRELTSIFSGGAEDDASRSLIGVRILPGVPQIFEHFAAGLKLFIGKLLEEND